MTDERIHEIATALLDFCSTSKLSDEKKIMLIEAKIKETIKIIESKKNG